MVLKMNSAVKLVLTWLVILVGVNFAAGLAVMLLWNDGLTALGAPELGYSQALSLWTLLIMVCAITKTTFVLSRKEEEDDE